MKMTKIINGVFYSYDPNDVNGPSIDGYQFHSDQSAILLLPNFEITGVRNITDQFMRGTTIPVENDLYVDYQYLSGSTIITGTVSIYAYDATIILSDVDIIRNIRDLNYTGSEIYNLFSDIKDPYTEWWDNSNGIGAAFGNNISILTTYLSNYPSYALDPTKCYFLNLDNLNINHANVKGLNSLINFYCSGNRIINVDLSGLINLDSLDCSSNQITSLDLTTLSNLTYLHTGYNRLTTLNVSNLNRLTTLDCEFNILTSLIFNRLNNIQYLSCDGNQITSLDISGSMSLNQLSCDNNLITSLNASGLTSLTSLHCRNNQLTSLDVSGDILLTELACSDNQITSLNINGSTLLFYIGCSNNQLTSDSIQSIFSDAVSSNMSSGYVVINGGSNAGYSTWSSQAISDYNTLISSGVTVQYNS